MSRLTGEMLCSDQAARLNERLLQQCAYTKWQQRTTHPSLALGLVPPSLTREGLDAWTVTAFANRKNFVKFPKNHLTFPIFPDYMGEKEKIPFRPG